MRRSPKPKARLGYQQQDSAQTLAEGLAEYYAANAGRVTRPADLPPKSADLFRRHDTCHVIFGLDTSPEDETITDTRAMLSCDVGLRRYAGYLLSDPQAKAIFKEFGVLEAVWLTIRSVPRMGRAALEALKMTRRWPWNAPDGYQHRTLADLRREYGIRLI
jgi:hypothetical protein